MGLISMYLLFFYILLSAFAYTVLADCQDNVDNLITAQSDLSRAKPAIIRGLHGTVYREDGTPACNQKRPTVLLPGYVKLLGGELHVPTKYDLVKSGIMKLTVRGVGFDDPLCLNGESSYIALPSSFCKINLCQFIGTEMCEILQQPGIHTIDELSEKLGFNNTLRLPDPPSLLGISLLDLFSGEFSFGFTVESDGHQILDLTVPTNEKFLQIGVSDGE